MEELVFEEEIGVPSAFNITFGDVLVFINWMNQIEKSLDRAEALPPLPDVDSDKVRGWIQLVRRLEEGLSRNEEQKRALEANVIAHETQIEQLFSHMHTNLASLYENLGHAQKVTEVRRHAEAVHVG
jgi:predicted  nucleic acid-binding Zn-ribbon protein